VEQYRTYLRAELGKLGCVDDGRDFLALASCCLQAFGLRSDPDWLASAFASQDQVDAYVARLSPQALEELTTCCDRWRNNNIANALSPRQGYDLIDVAVENILLSQAEPALGDLFRRHAYRLGAIASDPELLAAAPYSSHRPREEVRFRRCLARLEPGGTGTYRMFDGMHRAVQMVRNGEAQMPLCVVHDP
jgi:hypothetical protein